MLEDLVRKAQGGCGVSFERLVGLYSARVEALIHVRLGPALRKSVDVEDILQETHLRVYRSLPKFHWSGPAAFYHWAGRIAEHVILNFVRKLPGRLIVQLDGIDGGSGDGRRSLMEPMDEGELTPLTSLRRRERLERLARALDELTEEHREVIILARIRRLPIREIATRMGRSPDAISMLLLRALRKLKMVFGDTSSFHLARCDLDRPLNGDKPGGLA